MTEVIRWSVIGGSLVFLLGLVSAIGSRIVSKKQAANVVVYAPLPFSKNVPDDESSQSIKFNQENLKTANPAAGGLEQSTQRVTVN